MERSQRAAQSTMRDLDAAKASLEQVTRLRSQWDDIQTVLSMLDAGEEDEDIMKEGIETSNAMLKELEEWELQRVLSGRFDHMGCVLSIQSGAGGVDAMDWAQMLLRMYTRWAERKGFPCKVLEVMDGEEAGIKSATIEIDAPFACGYLGGEKGAHRLVRISPFNSLGKRQTSFAGVEVTPPQIPNPETRTLNTKSQTLKTTRCHYFGRMMWQMRGWLRP